MIMTIKLSFGRWTVNGKSLEELNNEERNFMNAFFREVKLGQDGNLCTNA